MIIKDQLKNGNETLKHKICSRLFNQRQNIKIRENKTRIKTYFDSLMKFLFVFWFCNFFGLIFVIKNVPGIHSVKCCLRGVWGCPGGVPDVFWGCCGVFRACSWFYRHPRHFGLKVITFCLTITFCNLSYLICWFAVPNSVSALIACVR